MITEVFTLQKIIVLDSDEQSAHVIPFSRLIQGPLSSKGADPRTLSEDIASILYTSGTTGTPKGVMLTHKNFCSNFQSIERAGMISEKDNMLSILPLHHSYPFMFTLIVPLFLQATVTYIGSLKKEDLLACLREARVTVLVGVPQVFYMFYKSIADELRKIPFLIRICFFAFTEMLWLIRKCLKINLAKLIFTKVHCPFGRSLRFFACGGAKLDEKVARFLVKIGF